MQRLKLLALLSALALAGCGTQLGADVGSVVSKVTGDAQAAVSDVKSEATKAQQFTQADVQAALDDAVAHQDGTGMACWAAAKDALSGPLPVGVASGIQRVRDILAVNIPFKCQNIIPGLSVPALPPGLVP